MPRAAGFTLLELLLVLLIVGLLTAISVAWLARGETLAADALQRLAEQASALDARARDSGQIIGLGWTQQGPARFEPARQEGAQRWRTQPLAGSWPQHVRPTPEQSTEPWVIFTPTGIARPASLHWQWPDGQAHWRWSGDGALQVE
ncbi:general secretion pathway protein H [Pseudomonas cuatrocienegasensis]|uniref:General secretion pathway protein H n=1 Tax=Pseudomonas cuatrocienegasensis TaxID=543360 RepID=A0ABY1BDH0_9PSED|nr:MULTISPECIES: prepilin-type N-terminal cleavage/methylation domain-containing protein [Pseudomonas]OEC33823.1 type II secretion system protein GspH [Pseudomonas sp. 21C1]SEQ59663.1 general secretion pathway protein H [Pseudomonas cuatrocienegasensis]